MDELGLDAANVAAWFQQQHVQPCIVIGVDKAHATSWTTQLLDAVSLGGRRRMLIDRSRRSESQGHLYGRLEAALKSIST
jgi:hypothetical protein